jgi:predicted small lipoprotein YifL
MRIRITQLLVIALVSTFAGCGSDSNANLSPTPDQDPERYERAKRANDEQNRKNQKAEQKLMKRMHRKPPQT